MVDNDIFKSFYAKLPGILEMGIVKLEQYGLLHLHWHKGTTTVLHRILEILFKTLRIILSFPVVEK